MLDWFTNYLLEKEDGITDFGWVADIAVVFDEHQSVEIRPGSNYLCTAISFKAERVCDRYERLVGLSGTGFFNWNTKQATFAPGASILSDSVPMDFTQWQPRSTETRTTSGFIDVRFVAHSAQFEYVADAIKLDQL